MNCQPGKRHCSKSDCSHQSTCGALSSCVSTTRQKKNIRKTERGQHNKNLIPMPANLVQSLNDANGNVARLLTILNLYYRLNWNKQYFNNTYLCFRFNYRRSIISQGRSIGLSINFWSISPASNIIHSTFIKDSRQYFYFVLSENK